MCEWPRTRSNAHWCISSSRSAVDQQKKSASSHEKPWCGPPTARTSSPVSASLRLELAALREHRRVDEHHGVDEQEGEVARELERELDARHLEEVAEALLVVRPQDAPEAVREGAVPARQQVPAPRDLPHAGQRLERRRAVREDVGARLRAVAPVRHGRAALEADGRHARRLAALGRLLVDQRLRLVDQRLHLDGRDDGMTSRWSRMSQKSADCGSAYSEAEAVAARTHTRRRPSVRTCAQLSSSGGAEGLFRGN